jgi:hypothetical protein
MCATVARWDRYRPRANKILSADPDKCRPYDNCLKWRLTPKSVPTLETMATALRWLAARPFHMLARGAVRSGIDLDQPHYRRHADPNPELNSLVPAARAWMAIDVDGVVGPPGLGHGRCLDAAGYYVRDVLLPPEFHDIKGVVAATASTGLDGMLGSGPRGCDLLRLRLFFLLDRPIHDEILRGWLKGYAWMHRLEFDPAILNPTQPIYTARPTFDGIPDPVPVDRSVQLLDGDCGDRVDLQLSPYVDLTQLEQDRQQTARGATNASWRLILENELGGIDGYHVVIWRAFGRGIHDGDGDDEMVAGALSMIRARADAARVREYNERYLRARLRALRQLDRQQRYRDEDAMRRLDEAGRKWAAMGEDGLRVLEEAARAAEKERGTP